MSSANYTLFIWAKTELQQFARNLALAQVWAIVKSVEKKFPKTVALLLKDVGIAFTVRAW